MILVALGANLPGVFASPRAALMAATDRLRENGLRIAALSRIFITKPIPESDQPWYHNAVVKLETDLGPYALLELLQTIENDMGRVRAERNAPRVIDLDLIAHGDHILDKPELIVPHPRAHERAFVLLPLRDVAPDWMHPVSKTTLADLIARLPADQIATPETL